MPTRRRAVSGAALVLAAAVSGCAPTYVRYMTTTGASQQQFMADRYTCLRETQQRVSGAYVTQFGGAASSHVMPSCSALNACLAARGYYRADTSNRSDFNQPGSLHVPQGAMIQCAE